MAGLTKNFPITSISKLPKNHSGRSGCARVLAACRRSFSLEEPSCALTSNFRKPRGHFECVFARELAVFAPELAPLSAPGTARTSILELQTAVFSKFFHHQTCVYWYFQIDPYLIVFVVTKCNVPENGF